MISLYQSLDSSTFRYIRIETNVLGYAISGVLSQLISKTSPNLSQWHIVAFFSRKMIFAKTWYKIYDNELLATIEAFKT